MANNNDVTLALKKAAEALSGRQITLTEQNELVKAFNEAQGTSHVRAMSALSKFTRLDESTILIKAAASDNTDRVIDDLKNTLDNWKPS
jgi:hypothetical protein